jgi:hypothetical protein
MLPPPESLQTPKFAAAPSQTACGHSLEGSSAPPISSFTTTSKSQSAAR